MRRLHVGFGGTTVRFALCLAGGQQGDKAGQAVNLAALARNDVRKIIDRPDQVGHAFFQNLIAHSRTPMLAHYRPKG